MTLAKDQGNDEGTGQGCNARDISIVEFELLVYIGSPACIDGTLDTRL
jgi:hypothetical protein